MAYLPRVSVVLMLVTVLLWPQPTGAQSADSTCDDDPKTYISWFDALESMTGTATATGASSAGDRISADGYFAFLHGEDLSTTDYFAQLTVTEYESEDFFALLVTDNLVASFDLYSGWEVDLRDEYSVAGELEEPIEQFDSFLSAAFQQLRFIDMSTCLGVEPTAVGDAVHYSLTVPPLMGRMLLNQLTGEDVDDIEIGGFVLDYWLDQDDRFLSRLEIELEATDTWSEETISADLSLSLESTNNVSLTIPYTVQLLAMEQGLIEPNFIPEVVVLD